MKRDDGYTLVEMLVVIAIIGLLAAALTPALIGQLARARVKTAHLQLATVSSALESFRSDVGRYPTPSEGLKALVVAPPGAEGWVGPYIHDPKALNDPWNHAIVYHVDADTDQISVESLGSDGKPGGTGTAADIHSP